MRNVYMLATTKKTRSARSISKTDRKRSLAIYPGTITVEMALRRQIDRFDPPDSCTPLHECQEWPFLVKMAVFLSKRSLRQKRHWFMTDLRPASTANDPFYHCSLMTKRV